MASYTPPDPRDDARWRQQRENARRFQDKKRGIEFGGDAYKDPAGEAYDTRGVSQGVGEDENLWGKFQASLAGQEPTPPEHPVEPDTPKTGYTLDDALRMQGVNLDPATDKAPPRVPPPTVKPPEFAPADMVRQKPVADKNWSIKAINDEPSSDPFQRGLDTVTRPFKAAGGMVKQAAKDPIGTAAGIVTAPFESAARTGYGLGEALMEQYDPESVAAARRQTFQGQPDSWIPEHQGLKKTAIAGVQTLAAGYAGPVEGALSKAIANIGGRWAGMATNPITAYSRAAASSAVAGIAPKTAVGAAVGAAYSPDDPAAGVVLGGALGLAHGAYSGGPEIAYPKFPENPQITSRASKGPRRPSGDPAGSSTLSAGPSDLERAFTEKRQQDAFDARARASQAPHEWAQRVTDVEKAQRMQGGRLLTAGEPVAPQGELAPAGAPAAPAAPPKKAGRYTVTIQYDHRTPDGKEVPASRTIQTDNLRMVEKYRKSEGKGWGPFFDQTVGEKRVTKVDVQDHGAPEPEQTSIGSPNPAPANDFAPVGGITGAGTGPKPYTPRAPLTVHHGSDTEVILSDNSTLPARYAVAELNTIQPSHDPFTFNPNPNYPEGVQGRDYQRNEGAQNTVRARALEYHPQTALNPSKTAHEGQPVVLPDGTVLAGNERAMLPALASEHAPELYDEYRNQLKAGAAGFGLDPAEIDKFQRPVLVRMLTHPRDIEGGQERWGAINQLSDEPATKNKSGTEETSAWTGRLRQAQPMLDHLSNTLRPDESVSEYLGRADGQEFARGLAAHGVITKAQYGKMLEGGKLTEDGRNQVRKMLMASVVADPMVLNDTPDPIKLKLEHLAPALLSVHDGPYGMSGILTHALQTITDAKQAGRKVSSFRGQGDMINGMMPDEVVHLAEFLQDEPVAVVKEAFRKYATLGREALAKQDAPDAFGDTGISPQDAFAKAFGFKQTPPATKGSKKKATPAVSDRNSYSFDRIRKEYPEGTPDADIIAEELHHNAFADRTPTQAELNAQEALGYFAETLTAADFENNQAHHRAREYADENLTSPAERKAFLDTVFQLETKVMPPHYELAREAKRRREAKSKVPKSVDLTRQDEQLAKDPKICIIGCSATKAAEPMAAKDFYTSDYFKKRLALARLQVDDAHIFILSAKHGLIGLNETVEPYDLRLGQKGSVDPETVQNQAIERNIDMKHAIVLAGKDYVELAKKVWPGLHAPLKGGIGEQLKQLKELTTPKGQQDTKKPKVERTQGMTVLDRNQAQKLAGASALAGQFWREEMALIVQDDSSRDNTYSIEAIQAAYDAMAKANGEPTEDALTALGRVDMSPPVEVEEAPTALDFAKSGKSQPKMTAGISAYILATSAPRIHGSPGTFVLSAEGNPTLTEIASRVAEAPWAAQLARAASHSLSKMHEVMHFYLKHQPLKRGTWREPVFAGFGVDVGWYGMHLTAQPVADHAWMTSRKDVYEKFNGSGNLILLNPFAMLESVMDDRRALVAADESRGLPRVPWSEIVPDRLDKFSRGAAPITGVEAIAEGLAARLWGTVMHENAHEWGTGHDEDFALALSTAIVHLNAATVRDPIMRVLRRASFLAVTDEEFRSTAQEVVDVWNKSGKSAIAKGSGTAFAAQRRLSAPGNDQPNGKTGLAEEGGRGVPEAGNRPDGRLQRGAASGGLSFSAAPRKPVGQSDLFGPPPAPVPARVRETVQQDDLFGAPAEAIREHFPFKEVSRTDTTIKWRGLWENQIIELTTRQREKHVDVVVNAKDPKPWGIQKRARFAEHLNKFDDLPAIVRVKGEGLESGVNAAGEVRGTGKISAEEMADRRDELGNEKSTIETSPDQGGLFGQGGMAPAGKGTPKGDGPIGSAGAGLRGPAPMPTPTGFMERPTTIEALKKAAAELQQNVRPERQGDFAGATAATIRMYGARMARSYRAFENALQPLSKMLEKMSRGEAVKAWTAAERGEKTGNPELDQGIRLLHQITGELTNTMIDLGILDAQKVISNYIGRFWSKPKNAKQARFIDSIRNKRPAEGMKSFLKKRSLMEFEDGLHAGLVPATYNFVDAQLAKMTEMLRFIQMRKIILQEMNSGRMKKVLDTSTEMPVPYTPDGRRWVKIGDGTDPAFVVFGPQKLLSKHAEGFDSNQRLALYDVMKRFNIKHQRALDLSTTALNVGRNWWGWAELNSLKMATKFGGDNAVIMHELGHILDWLDRDKNLWDQINLPPREMETVELERKSPKNAKIQREKGDLVTRVKKRTDAEVEYQKTVSRELADLADQRDATWLSPEDAVKVWDEHQQNLQKKAEGTIKGAEGVLKAGVDSKGTALTAGRITSLNNLIEKLKAELQKPAPGMPDGWMPIEHGASRKAYVRNRYEKIANAVHALLYAPELMDQYAPTVKAKLIEIFSAHPDLKRLLDIKPGLALGVDTRIEEIEYKGVHIVGHYYAPPESAKIFNNYLSKGYGDKGWFQSWMGASRAQTQVILGISGFHAFTIATEAVFSAFAQAADEVLTTGGSWKKAGKYIARGIGQPVSGAALGRKIIKELRVPGSYPELAPVVAAMVDMGYREQTNVDMFSADRVKKFRKNIRRIVDEDSTIKRGLALAGLPWRTLFATIELFATPVLGKYVPWVKAAATYSMVQQFMAQNPNASPEDIRLHGGHLIDQADRRFGEVIYENYFIHNTLKSLAQGLIMAPGWTAGTIALLAGGARDIVTAPRDIYRGMKGGGKPPVLPPSSSAGSDFADDFEGEESGAEKEPVYDPINLPKVGRNATYLVMGLIGYAMANALLNYLMHGDVEDAKDLYSVRTGDKDEMGNDNRYFLPGYYPKDFRTWTKDTWAAVAHFNFMPFVKAWGNKLSPTLNTARRVAANRDYNGNMLYDPDAEGWQKAKEVTRAVVGQSLPISLQNYNESVRRGTAGGVGSGAVSMTGIGPAARDFVRTPAQNAMMDYLTRTPHTAMTPVDVEDRQQVAQLRERLSLARKSGDKAAQDAIVTELVQLGEAGTASISQFRNTIGVNPNGNQLTRRFQRLTYEQAVKVWALAQPWERDILKMPMMMHSISKMKNSFNPSNIPLLPDN